MCLQARDLIGVTVSDHLKLLFDASRKLLVPNVTKVHGRGVASEVLVPVSVQFLGCIARRGWFGCLGVLFVWPRGGCSRKLRSAVFQALFL